MSKLADGRADTIDVICMGQREGGGGGGSRDKGTKRSGGIPAVVAVGADGATARPPLLPRDQNNNGRRPWLMRTTRGHRQSVRLIGAAAGAGSKQLALTGRSYSQLPTSNRDSPYYNCCRRRHVSHRLVVVVVVVVVAVVVVAQPHLFVCAEFGSSR